jgi:DNA-binding MarR family transcriptional regulator
VAQTRTRGGDSATLLGVTEPSSGDPHRPDEPRTSYLIGRLDRALRRALEEGVRAHGLTVAQYTAMSVIRSRSGLSNAQLARLGFMSPQGAHHVLRALDEGGLVHREPDPNHGRVIRTTLTARGKRVIAACDRHVEVVEALMFDGIDEAELSMVRRHLRTALHGLEHRDPDAWTTATGED